MPIVKLHPVVHLSMTQNRLRIRSFWNAFSFSYLINYHPELLLLLLLGSVSTWKRSQHQHRRGRNSSANPKAEKQWARSHIPTNFRVAIQDQQFDIVTLPASNPIFATSIFDTIIAHSQVDPTEIAAQAKVLSLTWNFNCCAYQLELKLLPILIIDRWSHPRVYVNSPRLTLRNVRRRALDWLKVDDCSKNLLFFNLQSSFPWWPIDWMNDTKCFVDFPLARVSSNKK